jgi:hypothetical protein
MSVAFVKGLVYSYMNEIRQRAARFLQLFVSPPGRSGEAVDVFSSFSVMSASVIQHEGGPGCVTGRIYTQQSHTFSLLIQWLQEQAAIFSQVLSLQLLGSSGASIQNDSQLGEHLPLQDLKDFEIEGFSSLLR